MKPRNKITTNISIEIITKLFYRHILQIENLPKPHTILCFLYKAFKRTWNKSAHALMKFCGWHVSLLADTSKPRICNKNCNCKILLKQLFHNTAQLSKDPNFYVQLQIPDKNHLSFFLLIEYGYVSIGIRVCCGGVGIF